VFIIGRKSIIFLYIKQAKRIFFCFLWVFLDFFLGNVFDILYFRLLEQKLQNLIFLIL